MKKILLLFGLFGFSLTYGQQLANFYLEPTINPNTVTLHTTVYHFNLAYYLEHTVDIQGNEVNFNLCYSNTYFTSGTYDQKEFNINLPSGFSEFIFKMNFFTWDEFGLCDYNNPLDNSSFQFDFPYTPTETTSIPDDNFEGYLELKGFGDDVANNHLVFTHRFLNLSHLWMDEHDLNQMGLSQIESLSGIENLYRLKEIWCQNNLIEHFDATMHPLAERLWLSGNPLNEVNVSNSPNLLILNAAQTAVENVDLTNNPYLKVLSLGSLNINYIDITQNPDLFDLDLIGTSIESIDLSNNLLLRSINISNNPFLESVLIENNDELNYIYIDNNDSLESIVFINTPALDNINCSENASLTNLDVLGCENLRVLVTQSNPNLTSLDLSGNPLLETLAITENNLNSLDLRNGNTTTLTLVLAMDNPYLYCVEVDDPTSAPYGQWLFDNEVIYSDDCTDPIIYIPDVNLKNALINFPVVDITGNGIGDVTTDINNDDEIQWSEAQFVENLIVPNFNISSLEGLQYFLNLTILKAQENSITGANFSTNSMLVSLDLSENQLTQLDISQNPNLENLWVFGNELTFLSIVYNVNLQSFRIHDNNLEFLNIKNGYNELLEDFLVFNNPSLSCIKVDNIEFAYNNPNWIKDKSTKYSEDCLLGITDFELESKLKIYPNPTENLLSLETTLLIENVSIYSLDGKLIKGLKLKEYTLDISNLSKGIYFLQIETEEHSKIFKKIIKK